MDQDNRDGFRRHLNYSNVMSTLAVFLVIAGGTAIAASVKRNSVKSTSVRDNSLTQIDLKDGRAVGSAEVIDNALTGNDIDESALNLPGSPSSLPPGGAAGGSLTGDYPNPGLAAGSVGTAQVADGAVTSGKLAAGSVGTQQLANSSVTAAALSAASVGTAQIADGSVGSTQIANDSIDTTDIATDGVGAAEIGQGVVGSDELGSNSVDSPEILNNAVDSNELDDNSVNTSEIVDDAVTSGKIDDDAIGSSDIATGGVASSDIASGGVQGVDLNSSGGMTMTFGPMAPGGCQTLGIIIVAAADGNVQDDVVLATAPSAFNAVGGFTLTARPGGQPDLIELTVCNVGTGTADPDGASGVNYRYVTIDT